MLDYLFSPLTIKSVTIPNRLVVAPMVTCYCNEDGTANEQYIAYHEEKAKGGFGLIITEDYAITPQGKGFKRLAGLWNDDQIESHSELPRRVHQYGAKIFAQVYHAGRQTSAFVIGERPVAPSSVPDPYSQEIPKELTIEEIETIIEQYGDCALRAKKAGFDGIELHGAHGYLLSEFMSLYANKRTDKYGGPLENRLRFPIEVIKNVRAKCGEDFLIDYRISGDEFVPGGRTIEDTKTIVPFLVEAGIDLIHISGGVYASVDRFIPPQATRHGVLADLAKEVKEVVSIPVITVNRINDPFIANQIIGAGKADFVALARPTLTDPGFAVKAKEGRYGDIRRCIACNVCLEHLFRNEPIICVLNPTVGREFEQPTEPAAKKKNVAVIGGGPAGMQAAISAAELGHDVTLFEKDSILGGNFRIAAMPPAKGELVSFINWQEQRMNALGVAVKLNTPATIQTIGEADAIILATGATSITPQIPGVDGENVMHAVDVLSGKVLPGKRVVVIGGGETGTETANYLGIIDRYITIVEMQEEIAPFSANAVRHYLIRSLKENGVKILTNTEVREITEHSVVTDKGEEIAADTVVLALGFQSENTIMKELEAAGKSVLIVGDAKEPRSVMEAVKEGYEAALSL